VFEARTTESRAAACALLLIAIFVFGQCGQIFYPEFESHSPDGRYTLAIIRNRPSQAAGYRYRVELRGAGMRRTLLRGNEPSSIGLVEANWSVNGRVVRLFFCDGPTPVAAGFDLQAVRTLGPDEVLPVLLPQIARRYSIPGGAPIVAWACSAAGLEAYTGRPRLG
jgi:hypothetical protein